MPDIVYRRNLPHIHPEGFPLFITFRLADSLPTNVLEDLNKEREQELRSASGALKRYAIHERQFAKYDDWLDRCAAGSRWLEENSIANIVAEKIVARARNYYELFAYRIMPNHVHLLLRPFTAEPAEHRGRSAGYPATEILRLIKGNTARNCNMALNRTGSFWHHESYDHFIRDEKEMERITRYILQNPVKAGLVIEWTDWKFTYVNPNLGSW